MTTRAQISEPRWGDREAEIPDGCPGCGADLTADGAVECRRWSSERCLVGRHAADQAGGGLVAAIEPTGERREDDLHEEDFRCSACGTALCGPGVGPTPAAPPGRTPPTPSGA